MKSDLLKRNKNELNHFNKMAKVYDENYGYNDKFTQYKIDKKCKILLEIVEKNTINDPKIILEIGCGTGEYTKRLAKLFLNSIVIASDISENILSVTKKKCKKFNNIKYEVIDAYNLKKYNNKIDIVCGFYVLHHLNIKRSIEQILSALKKNGLLFFYEPNILNPIVYLIKSNGWIKKMVGDSPDEWAINPLTIEKHLNKMEVIELKTS